MTGPTRLPEIPTRAPGGGAEDAVGAMTRNALVGLLTAANEGDLFLLLADGDGDTIRRRRAQIAYQLRGLGWPLDQEYLDDLPRARLVPELRESLAHRHVHRISPSGWVWIRSLLEHGEFGEEGRALAVEAGIEVQPGA